MRTLGAKVLAAASAKEIDSILEELTGLQAAAQFYDDGSERKGAALVRSTQEFAGRWQEFLAARGAGNLEKGRSILGELTGYGREYPGIPRSEILARAYGEDAETTGAKKGADTGGVLVSPEQILGKMKTLDDLDRLLPEFESSTAKDQATWSTTKTDLRSIARAYRDLRAGNSARVMLGLSGFDNREPLATLRGQLAVFALPRILGVAEADQPRPEENASTYLRRMLATARERKDWQFASRIVTATQTAQVGDVLAKSSDSSALNSFLAALNLEKAGEYSLAVNSFQTALKTGSDLIPVEDIGTHLAAIKRDHAADYEAGLQLTVNPPAPRTDSFGRPTSTTRSGMPEGRPPFANPQDPAQPAKEQPVPVPARSEAAPGTAKPAAPESEQKKP